MNIFKWFIKEEPKSDMNIVRYHNKMEFMVKCFCHTIQDSNLRSKQRMMYYKLLNKSMSLFTPDDFKIIFNKVLNRLTDEEYLKLKEVGGSYFLSSYDDFNEDHKELIIESQIKLANSIKHWKYF